jgi:uncharacterized RDD family membrane protein YckC
VRAHKVRKHKRLDPNSPLLDFAEPDSAALGDDPSAARHNRSWWGNDAVASAPSAPDADSNEYGFDVNITTPTQSDATIAEVEAAPAPAHETDASAEEMHYDRPPLAPFPRINTQVPKIIEFPRMQTRHYELAEPVGDQLRIFEAEELPPPPTNHLTHIEIAPAEPAYIGAADIEVPIQCAPIGQRIYAATVDAAIMIAAFALFGFSAQLFATSLPMTKPLLASGAICLFLLLTIYYLLSLSMSRGTAGMEVSGLRVITFSGGSPSRMILHWRALATALSYAALGMGFAWSLIDEDRLCWHDRITHTYLILKN